MGKVFKVDEKDLYEIRWKEASKTMVNCFRKCFRGEWHSRIARYIHNQKVKSFTSRIHLLRSVRLWNPSSFRDTRLQVTFGSYLKQCSDKHRVREVAYLSVTKCLRYGSQLTDKKSLNKLYIFFRCFDYRFRQARKYPLQ